jgi:hypothetical protein
MAGEIFSSILKMDAFFLFNQFQIGWGCRLKFPVSWIFSSLSLLSWRKESEAGKMESGKPRRSRSRVKDMKWPWEDWVTDWFSFGSCGRMQSRNFCMQDSYFFFSLFWWDWGLNSELSYLVAGALSLEPHLQPFSLWLFWRQGLAFCPSWPGLQPSRFMLPLLIQQALPCPLFSIEIGLLNFLSGLTLNLDPPYLSVLSSWYYSREPLALSKTHLVKAFWPINTWRTVQHLWP